MDNMQNADAEQMARNRKQLAVARIFRPQHSDKEFIELAVRSTDRLRAAAEGDIATLRKTNDSGKISALMVACRFKQRDAVQMLLDSARLSTRRASLAAPPSTWLQRRETSSSSTPSSARALTFPFPPQMGALLFSEPATLGMNRYAL